MSGLSVAGLRFGRYEVVRPIGEGGMAQVYLCRRLGVGGFERPVVLKVLHSRFVGDPPTVDMFLEEAQMLARLHHPNIVGVFEVECVGGVPYLAMEYVNGPTLGDLQRHVGRPGPANVGVFLVLVRQVCDALHHAHTLKVGDRPMGVVHRDVSSQNIVIDAGGGFAKLIDFGIAKAVDAVQHTEIGVLKGKIHYMAPEVLAGGRPDARADIYSVGVLLHRMITGRLPNQEGEATAPREVVFPPGMAEIVARAMSTDPDQRYPSAAQLAVDLQQVIDGLGVTPSLVAPFVARVFPRGELDWRRYHEGRATPHGSVLLLASETAEEVNPSGAPRLGGWVRPLLLFAFGATLLSTVFVLAAMALVAVEVVSAPAR